MNICPHLKDDEVLVIVRPHESDGSGCLVPHPNKMPCGRCVRCGEPVAWYEWDSGCISVASNDSPEEDMVQK